MAENLVIVESPAKAKTIEGFLGKDFVVKSSYGHVRDLAKANNGVMIEKNFEPLYEISEDKEKVISELTKLSKKAKTVWLATDEDREGEAISWHLAEVLGLKDSSTKRIVFHEITKDAILNAIENPRKIDKHLVDAQQARRILDRLVGFELSPILWRKVKPSLSAGRVQSVAVRLIVERERDIEAFKVESFYKVVAHFIVKDKNGNVSILKAELDKKFKTEKEASAFLEKQKNAVFTIESLEKKPATRKPSAPFTTSTLQQEASRKLGFAVATTMSIAQKLYESGKITYMRTDSVNLSEQALANAAKEIKTNYGGEYHQKRQYQTKSSSAQEAHEAIRPTSFNRSVISGSPGEQRLYELIWKRAIASQMADAKLERTIVKVNSSNASEKFVATGEVIIFDGFLKVYMESTDDDNEEENDSLLPPMSVGQKLTYDSITATQRFTQPPARFTEASLVKKLEELGIGRPSTYAPTISTILKRGYVVKEERQGKERAYNVLELKADKLKTIPKTEITGAEKNKIYPTDTGVVVNDFLVEYFGNILDYNFTAEIEKEFDEIAEGKMKWNKMIADFYKPFHKNVENTIEKSERATGERVLGKDPKTKRKVIVRLGRFGPMAEIVAEKESDSPLYSSLKKGQRLETITLEEALELFKLPRQMGEYKGKEIVINNGRFGPYIKYGDEYISLPKEEDPVSIDLDSIKSIIDGPRLPRTLGAFQGQDVVINKGRFGPYIKYGAEFISLPKGEDPLEIELETVIEILKKPRLPRNVGEYDGQEVIIAKGRFGPYIKYGQLFVALKKTDDPFEVSLERLIELIEEKKSGGSVKANSGAAKKSKASKASAKKETKTKEKASVKKKAAAKKKSPAVKKKAASSVKKKSTSKARKK
ncbi:MAG: DNA topoisomerase 1 [Bacteroidetes bacterium ADurb.Bin141]|nr:MAG: DNA topoisomerase I [Bacteroidetes bacterium OLB10]MBV6454309.1 DNA topoisomerase 1 [Bacteroidia bacterium]MBX3106017.1 type I DNA topoisomerase [Bacteroidota bacterium]OQB61541.1 MAG: DNA topoisomerase 1 [Bacteroidetes bacterium ADurb.Bin141]MCB8929836.1 type I DNA topoisomerase [Bacteroidia bacterium]